MPRFPVDSVNVVSGYQTDRANHFAFDLGGAEGTDVFAPEAMTIVAVWRDNATAPFVGYGPGGVEALGASGVHHLLAHLAPDTIPFAFAASVPLREGAFVGKMSSMNHVHWEVRLRPVDTPETRKANTLVPDDWLKRALAGEHFTAQTAQAVATTKLHETGAAMGLAIVVLAILMFGGD